MKTAQPDNAHRRSLATANFPRPYPDELAYSALARASIHCGYWSAKRLLDVVYQNRTSVAVPDLPTGLVLIGDFVADAWGLSIDQVIERHTLWPYYAAYRPQSERKTFSEAMRQCGSSIHVRLGICTSRVCRTGFFRLCPVCTALDLEQYGETYWRRAHHLPGVVVCPHHGAALLRTSIPFRPLWRHEHIAPASGKQSDTNPLLSDRFDKVFALEVAIRSASLLNPSALSGGGSVRDLAATAGLVGRWGAADRLRDEYQRRVSPGLHAAMFTDRYDALGWLDVLRRAPRRAIHPLKHLLLELLIQAIVPVGCPPVRLGRRWGLARDTELRGRAAALRNKGASTREIAKSLGVAWRTAARLLEPPRGAAVSGDPGDTEGIDRIAWRDLVAQFPNETRSQVRRRQPALYSRLYRADRAWLLEQACATGVAVRSDVVDWEARDIVLSEKVLEVTQSIRLRNPTVRASESRVLGELQARALLAHYAEKLPRTRDTLTL